MDALEEIVLSQHRAISYEKMWKKRLPPSLCTIVNRGCYLTCLFRKRYMLLIFSKCVFTRHGCFPAKRRERFFYTRWLEIVSLLYAVILAVRCGVPSASRCWSWIGLIGCLGDSRRPPCASSIRHRQPPLQAKGSKQGKHYSKRYYRATGLPIFFLFNLVSST